MNNTEKILDCIYKDVNEYKQLNLIFLITYVYTFYMVRSINYAS